MKRFDLGNITPSGPVALVERKDGPYVYYKTAARSAAKLKEANEIVDAARELVLALLDMSKHSEVMGRKWKDAAGREETYREFLMEKFNIKREEG